MSLPKGDSSFEIEGPAGRIEGICSLPPQDSETAVGIVCHPHPLHGGAMTNKVVHTVAKAITNLGAPCFRFNFRGVGNSEGEFDNTIGESKDALAVIEFAQTQFPGRDLWLAGFSFGAYIALNVSQYTAVNRLISVAPAVNLYDLDDFQVPDCPWLLIQGDDDEIVPVDVVQDWLSGLHPQPQTVFLPETGHFFHGKLVDLRTHISNFLSTSEH